MIIELTYDELISNQYEVHTDNTVKNKFYSTIIHYLIKYNVKDIIINVKMAVIFQDYQSYKSISNPTILLSSTDTYILGSINKTNIWLNPKMRWDENNIIIKDSLLNIRKNKLLKIIKGKEFVDVLEEIHLDNKLSDFLI